MRRLWLLWLLAACSGVDEPAEVLVAVHCAPATSESWPDTVVLSGVVTARPGGDALISAEEPGRLVRVLVDVGEHVEAGQALAEVAPLPLKAALASAEASLRAAETERDDAIARHERATQLVVLGTGTVAEVELADAARARAVGAAAAAQETLRTAGEHLSRATVRAPFAGVVVRLHRRDGEVVDGTPNTPLLQLADAEGPQLLTTVAPSLLDTLAVGQQAWVTLAHGDPLAGSVAAVVPMADPSTGLASARISLDVAAYAVPLGMLGQAEVALSEPRPRVVVPPDALRVAGEGRQVVRCVDGLAGVTDVEMLDRRADGVAVSGLNPGDSIVVGGVVGLEDGMALEVLP